MVPSDPKCADQLTGKKSILQTGEAPPSVRCETSPKPTSSSVGKQPKVRLHTAPIQSSLNLSNNLAKPPSPLAGTPASKPSRKAKFSSPAEAESSSEQKSNLVTKAPSLSQASPKGANLGTFQAPAAILATVTYGNKRASKELKDTADPQSPLLSSQPAPATTKAKIAADNNLLGAKAAIAVSKAGTKSEKEKAEALEPKKASPVQGKPSRTNFLLMDLMDLLCTSGRQSLKRVLRRLPTIDGHRVTEETLRQELQWFDDFIDFDGETLSCRNPLLLFASQQKRINELRRLYSRRFSNGLKAINQDLSASLAKRLQLWDESSEGEASSNLDSASDFERTR